MSKLNKFRSSCVRRFNRANINLQAINKNPNPLNTSGQKGVSWDSSKLKWRAFLTLKGKRLLDRMFTKKEDAIKARKDAEQLYFKPLLEGAS